MIEKIQIICGDFEEAIKGLSNESAGRLFKALFAYAADKDPSEELKDDITASTLFPVMRNHIDRHEDFRRTKSESGRKGGFAKANSTKGVANCSKSVANVSTDVAKSASYSLPIPIPNKKNNKFVEGALGQTYDFADVEKKIVKN